MIKLWKKSVVDKPTLLIFCAVFLGSLLTAWTPVIVVALAAAAGILVHLIGGKRA